MTRLGTSIVLASVAGIASVSLLPPLWLTSVFIAGVLFAGIFAIIARFNTKTEPRKNPTSVILLLLFNLPEQPFAKVKEGWALTMLLASRAFLVSMGLWVMVLANA